MRKSPVSADETLTLVRRYRHAYAKRGAALYEFDPKTATDAEILKLFLGREGNLRAPTIVIDDVILGGWDEPTVLRLLGR